MAGHSQWANIKHRKALVDSKRSKLWSKLSKAIIVAAKLGGGDPSANIRLRTAIIDAKAVSLPKDNIDRAIKKGTGELDGGDVEEILYEGYGPGGVAILCDIMTDNRNRTQGIAIESKQVTRVPNLTVEVDSETAVSVMKLLEKLEDHDDVQSVATNVNFTAEQLANLG